VVSIHAVSEWGVHLLGNVNMYNQYNIHGCEREVRYEDEGIYLDGIERGQNISHMYRTQVDCLKGRGTQGRGFGGLHYFS
jgi:hypothetical protein